jgi:hypothetical protein
MSDSVRLLAQCGTDEECVTTRCGAILKTLAPSTVKLHGDYYVELPPGGPAWWVYLGNWDDNCIAVRTYPGDTMNQARKFFERVRRREFLELEGRGWEVTPRLHFSYMQSEICNAEGTKLNLQEYLDYWASEEIVQARRDSNGFQNLFHQLLGQRLVDENDLSSLNENFTRTKRDHINVCPGFEVTFSWKRGDANRLDRKGCLCDEVRIKANEALETWGQTL